MSEGLPLDGVRVLDLSRVLAGPFATMTLADLGADVIKVERPGTGDETRSWGPPDQAGISSYFLSINRNKRSLAIDLATEEGIALVHRLAKSADVVIENFKPGGADRMGLGWDVLSTLNPGLVYCSISGFGSGRSPAHRPGYDLIIQAESGLMSITGSPDGPPERIGVALVDVLTGQQAAIGILAALRQRDQTGHGQLIEISLLDASIAALVNIAQNAIATGADPPRIGPAHPSIVPYQLFDTSDDQILIAAANDPTFERLCAALELDDLPADERFATNPDRVRNRDQLVPLLGERLLTRPAGEWLETLADAGVPSGKVRGVHDAIQAAAAAGEPVTVGVDIDTGDGGSETVELIRQPLRFVSGGFEIRHEAPPHLGEHSREILLEEGLKPDEVDRLFEAGTIAGPETG